MDKKLRNLVTGVLATVATLAPMKNIYSQGIPPNDSTATPLEVIGNTFSQPNILSKPLHWYGSGDANDDGKVDSTDVQAIQNGASNWMSDVNGDGVTDSADSQMITDYLNGQIDHLPGYWNKLQTRDERLSWLKKMIAIDKTDTIPRNNPSWICGDRTFLEGNLNFHSLSNATEFVQNNHTYGGDNYPLDNLAEFNIPAYIAGTNANTLAHSILATLVGDSLGNINPLNFKDWYFWSAYTDSTVLPGDPSGEMRPNSPVSLGLVAYFKDIFTNEPVFSYIDGIVRWNFNNGVATLESYDPYVVKENPNFMKVHILKGNLEDITIDWGDIPAGQKLTPDFLKSLGYNSIPDTSKENTTLPINLEYIDSDTTYNSDSTSYSFNRKFYDWIYSGGITVTDTLGTLEKISVINITAIDDVKNNIPKDFEVYQNYPNPFNPTTTIKYQNNKYGDVKLNVYDILGRKLESRTQKGVTPGKHKFDVDMSKYSSGIYLFEVSEGKNHKIIKSVLQK